jgi:hypothetical protein
VGDSKLEIKVGSITFSGEGAGDWLAKQFDKLLDRAPELLAAAPPDDNTGDNTSGGGGTGNGGPGAPSGKTAGTLASYLKATGSTSNQVRKFLATAAWLHDSEGKKRLTTKEVSDALNSHNQGKFTNPAECLNKNVGKGHCVKDGKTFYVVPDGRASLGK